MRRDLSFSLIALSLSGCISLDPHYRRPAQPTPAMWPTGPAYGPQSASTEAVAGWRAFFVDPRLNTVIGEALTNNRDLRVAVANIQIARAQSDIQRSQLFPTLNGQAGASFGREPLTSAGAPAANGHINIHQFNLGLGVSGYELDLFGRQRSLSRAAFEQYLATDQARRAAQISLVAQVASAWLTVGSDSALLAVAKDTAASARSSLLLTQARLTGGIASALDVSQAATLADQFDYDVAHLTTVVAQDVNALNLLVGAAVGPALLPTGVEDRAVLQDVPAGISSAVLLQRPDILQAEDRLRADYANIGAARAAFFPSLSLTASGGLASSALSTLIGVASGGWSFAPQIALPIFDAGRNRAGLASARATREVGQAQYEKAIQTGFREVADALAQRGAIGAQLGAQQALAAAAADGLRLAQARYAAGVATYLDVLIAQRTYYAARQTLIAAQLAQATNLVTLYTALGGGLD